MLETYGDVVIVCVSKQKDISASQLQKESSFPLRGQTVGCLRSSALEGFSGRSASLIYIILYVHNIVFEIYTIG